MLMVEPHGEIGMASNMHVVAWTIFLRETAWERMDPATRGKVFLILACIVLLGFLMLSLVWIAGRMTRHYGNRPIGLAKSRTPEPDVDAWAKKPLVHADDDDSSDDIEDAP